jgi:hypothetical protein
MQWKSIINTTTTPTTTATKSVITDVKVTVVTVLFMHPFFLTLSYTPVSLQYLSATSILLINYGLNHILDA